MPFGGRSALIFAAFFRNVILLEMRFVSCWILPNVW